VRETRFRGANFGNAYCQSCESKNDSEDKNERTSHSVEEGVFIMREGRKSNKTRRSKCDAEARIPGRRAARHSRRRRHKFDSGRRAAGRFQIGPKGLVRRRQRAVKLLKRKARQSGDGHGRDGHGRALGVLWVAFQRSAPFAIGEEGARLRMGRVVPTCL
jgi:hypothetical protein